MKTKEEILGDHFTRLNPDGGEYRTEEDIYNAMQEFAQQEAEREAIGFDSWKNRVYCYDYEYDNYVLATGETLRFTREELYKLYKQAK